jgi:hypothetical protein
MDEDAIKKRSNKRTQVELYYSSLRAGVKEGRCDGDIGEILRTTTLKNTQKASTGVSSGIADEPAALSDCPVCGAPDCTFDAAFG